MTQTELEIINQCINGNHEAFSQIVTKYKNLIYGVVYNMTNDKNEVNDMSQEVFLKIYKSLHKYDPKYKFSTWAVKITTNACIDKLKKKKAKNLAIEDINNISDNNNCPESEYIKEERNSKVKQAISSLPEKYRTPITLFHLNNVSYQELTEILNEPLSKVKNRLYRGRLMLKEKLLHLNKEGLL